MPTNPLVLKENAPPIKSGWPRLSLERFFAMNVVEIKFKRRVKPPFSDRRMLCTSNWRFVNSPIVKRIFRYTRPKGPARGAAWYRSKRLMIVWDLMKLQFRMVSLDRYEIVGFVPAKTLLEQAQFAAFYRRNISSLPPSKKVSFGFQQ